MPKKDFTQIAFAVVQQAMGEEPKGAPKPKKKAAPKVTKGTAKKTISKSRKAA